MNNFIKYHYAFRWYSAEWNTRQKWLYVALYVLFFNIGLIPLLVFSENAGLLIEGSTGSLATLLLLLVFWFALYQPLVNFIVAQGRKL